MKSSESYNWAAQREQKAFLALENGAIFHGYSIGAPVDGPGEVVFNTCMTGYQEIATNPSYAGQFICMTTPEIGAYGVNAEDMESARVFSSGLILHRISQASNWRSQQELPEALVQQGVPALAGVDTRALTALIRDKGTMKAFLSVTGTVPESAAVEKARQWQGLSGQDYVSKVTCEKTYRWDADNRLTATFPFADEILPPADYSVVAYDFGIRWNTLRGLRRAGLLVTVVPASTSADEVLAMKPDGVFLSNGPGDPAAVGYASDTVRELLGKIPLFGVCLGHQLLGIALGGKTNKLPFGHHGCNHPVKDLVRDCTLITAQDHNYVIEAGSIPESAAEITHINLNDETVEGLRARNYPAFSVQFHPEASSGIRDAENIFNRFYQLIRDTTRTSRRLVARKDV